MSKIKKYTKKLRKKLDKKNIDVKETDVMELKKLRNKGRVDDEYVFLRKNAFLSHLNYSNKNSVLKDKIKSDIFTV